MVSALSGMAIATRLLQLWNAFSSIKVNSFDSVAVSNLVQFQNVLQPISVTPSGSAMLFKFGQFQNVFFIETKPSGNVTDVRSAQSSNVSFKLVIQSGTQ